MSPDDIESDDGIKEYERYCLRQYYQAKRHREKTFKEAAPGITSQLVGIDVQETAKALYDLWNQYSEILADTEGIEKATKARQSLKNLSEKAFALQDAIMALEQGALEVMRSKVANPWLRRDADPDNLPDPKYSETCSKNAIHRDDHGDYLEYQQQGEWFRRLIALGSLAKLKEQEIEIQAGKGGRISFAARLRGSPEDSLAAACSAFAASHGGKTQAVVAKMVNTILKAEHGKDAKKTGGRKSVRKLAQTSNPRGTV